MTATVQPWHGERLPAFEHSLEAAELVLLHGWGSTAAIWRSWLPWLRQRANVTLLDLPGYGRTPAPSSYDLDTLLTGLERSLPARAALLGWSLGGMLAAEFAARQPQRCSALITIATNAVYVARPDWPEAQTAAQFAQFRQAVAANPAAQLRRFQGLQLFGDRRERELLRELRLLPRATVSPAVLDAGLALLADLDIRRALADCRVPGLHVFGLSDALVPAAAAEPFSHLVPSHWVLGLDGVAHLPFLSEPELCWQHVDRALFEARLIKRLPPPVRTKQAVAQSFGRAADSYDSVAQLQRHVAARLRSTLPPLRGRRVLDLGCGTGAETAALGAAAEVVALDLAEGMLAHARAEHAGTTRHWLCGDAENLPLATASVDTVFSSLAVQWCENLGAVFAEIARVLAPGGQAAVATLGPQTLHELRAAWAVVDAHVHVNPFAGRELIERALAASGLRCVAWQTETVVQHYAELHELTRELKALGAHNLNSGRPSGLTGRQRLQAFGAAYEQWRDSAGRLPASYEVWYLTLAKPAAEDSHG